MAANTVRAAGAVVASSYMAYHYTLGCISGRASSYLFWVLHTSGGIKYIVFFFIYFFMKRDSKLDETLRAVFNHTGFKSDTQKQARIAMIRAPPLFFPFSSFSSSFSSSSSSSQHGLNFDTGTFVSDVNSVSIVIVWRGGFFFTSSFFLALVLTAPLLLRRRCILQRLAAMHLFRCPQAAGNRCATSCWQCRRGAWRWSSHL